MITIKKMTNSIVGEMGGEISSSTERRNILPLFGVSVFGRMPHPGRPGGWRLAVRDGRTNTPAMAQLGTALHDQQQAQPWQQSPHRPLHEQFAAHHDQRQAQPWQRQAQSQPQPQPQWPSSRTGQQRAPLLHGSTSATSSTPQQTFRSTTTSPVRGAGAAPLPVPAAASTRKRPPPPLPSTSSARASRSDTPPRTVPSVQRRQAAAPAAPMPSTAVSPMVPPASAAGMASSLQVPSLQQHGTAVGQRLGAAGFGATGSSHPQQQQQLLQPEPQPEPEPEHHSARHEWNVLHTKGVSHHSDVGLVVRTQRLRALSLARSLTCSLRSVSGATTGWCRLRRMVNRDA